VPGCICYAVEEDNRTKLFRGFSPCVLPPPADGSEYFLSMRLRDSLEEQEEEQRVARLASLPITVPDGELCLSFWYRLGGGHAGALHVRQRGGGAQGGQGGGASQLLWTVSGAQGQRWREGRVILPHAPSAYQVRAPAPGPTHSLSLPLSDEGQ